MGTWKVSKMWFMALLPVVFVAGCGREQGILPPTLISISPNKGVQGQVVGVTLTGTNFATGATLNLSGALVTASNVTVVSSTQITATFAIAANAALGDRSVTVTTSGVTTSAVTFTVLPPLTVISTIPTNGATGVPVDQALTANFSQAVDCSTVTTSTFTLAGPAGAVAGTIVCAGASATFSPTSNLAINSLYAATITTGVADLAGTALASNYVWGFRTGPNPNILPAVISTDPANNAVGVPLNQKITATFNEAMDGTTITSATFTLTGPGGVAVPGAVTYAVAGSVAMFTPAAPLAALTTYVATITTGARDLDGDPLASSYVWTFTTGVAPDTTRPTIISTIAPNGAVGVPINQAVSATFSEAMDALTISGTTFTLAGPGGAVQGLVTYAAIAKTATFTPAANLLPSTQYTATVTAGAADLAGNPLGPGLVPNPWTFTTAPNPDIVAPTIISTNPVNASAGVPINATVNATFSEAMDPLTITTATFQLAGPGGAVVTGTVAYDPINFIATFAPSSNLAPNTTYAAEVTTGAADLAGNPLAPGIAPNPWSFTTAPVVVPSPVPLGTASTFGSFGGGAGITNQGILTVINGDIGTTGASTLITGFHDPGPGCTYTETPLNIGAVNGTIYTAPPPPTVGCPTEGTALTFAIATQAALDVLTAFNATSPASMPCTAFCAQGGELGGLTLTPGIYESAPGTFAITLGDLTLDAQGDPNAFWVFQSATSLTVGIAGPLGARSVNLINGAQAKNVFWHVGSAATINGAGGGIMVGTILAQSGVSFSTAGNVAITRLDGRALVLTGPVTMVNTLVNVPAP